MRKELKRRLEAVEERAAPLRTKADRTMAFIQMFMYFCVAFYVGTTPSQTNSLMTRLCERWGSTAWAAIAQAAELTAAENCMPPLRRGFENLMCPWT